MTKTTAATVFLLLQLVVGVFTQVNKTNVLKIGLVVPFGIPGVPIDTWSPLGTLASEAYNSMYWYIDRLNNQKEYVYVILPDFKIQLVVANSYYDRGLALTATQALAAQGIYGMVGEVISRNTASAALIASISKVFHCNSYAASTVLSNKGDYPYAYRTIPTLGYYGTAFLSLIKYHNVSTIAVLAADDEAGQSTLQELSSQAKSFNITIKSFVQFSPGKRYYTDELTQIKNSKVQTILVVASIVSANNLTMLDGDYWFITSVGFDAQMFTTPEEKSALNKMEGVWQLYGSKGQTGEAVEFLDYWNKQFYPNGTMIVNGTGAACDLTVPYARGCMGSGPFIAGSMPEYIRVAGLNKPLAAEYWMYASMLCVKTMAYTLDYYLKKGTVTWADVVARKVLTNAANGNISQFLNAAPVPHFWDNVMKFDKNGDAVMNISIANYRYDAGRQSVWNSDIGYFDPTTGKVNFYASYVFSGNKTSAPQPPPTPTNQFQAKMTLRYAFDGLIAVCSVISLALAVAMIFFIKQRIFKASSPVFLGLIILGANISFISIWLFSQYPMTSSSCITYGWLKYLGFAVVFGSLIVKTYRIFVIFTTKKKGKQNLSDGVLMSYFLVLLAIWVAILLVWTIVPSQRPFLDSETRYKLDEDGNVASVEVMPFCNFTGYNFVCLAAMVLTLVFGVFLTYSVRNTPGAFNESKWMAYAIYNWVVIGIVLNAIANFAVSNPDIIFVMEALTVIITQTGVCAFMIIPKLLIIRQGGGDEIETFNTSDHSKGTSSANRTGLGSAHENNKEVEAIKKKLYDAEKENEQLRKELEALKK
ncbi:hypothetical protein HDU97_001993 [Phlyctochytrium planicorne]|nr:hypothetical protein HDU97_001993 [Phlyctochytrium planicorne]